MTQGRDKDVRILVGELQSVREEIIMASLTSILKPMAWALPLLALGIWWAVRGSVRPLGQLGRAVAARQPQSLEPLPTKGVPPEVLPLVTALNDLFERTARLLATEQQFTADAAHELRTPIAGIRMQAQVAQGATDSQERARALDATVQGCDRATHLVEQLLQLARLDAEPAADSTHGTPLADVIRPLVAECNATAQRRRQRLVVAEPLPAPLHIPLPEPLARVLLRNLLDNALRYSPDGAQVRLQATQAQGMTELTVEDSGPGFTAEQQARLGERFFRVLGTGQTGSGLGWSIVQRIARIHRLQVSTDIGPGLGGLRVTVRW